MHLEDSDSRKGNAYRPVKVIGHEKLLELRIPRVFNEEFYPKVLVLLRNQQAETDKLVSATYVPPNDGIIPSEKKAGGAGRRYVRNGGEIPLVCYLEE